MGRSNSAIFANSAECLTESKALLKSRDITITYGFDCSRSVTLLSNEMMAAVVDPVGRKAN